MSIFGALEVLLILNFILHSVVEAASDSTIQTNHMHSSCPTWQYYDVTSKRCRCGSDIHGAVRCNDTINEVQLLDCYCMSVNKEGGMEVGKCFIGCARFQTRGDEVYYLVPEDKSQVNSWLCGELNKNGSFCGKCQSGFSPLVYSYDISCQKCTSNRIQNVIAFISAAFGPLTLFYILVVLFKVSATSPHLFSFVMFSQLMAEPISVRVSIRATRNHPIVSGMTRFIASVYGIWNLDFFRTLYPPICLNIPTPLMLALDYLPAFYALFLIAISYFLIKLHSCDNIVSKALTYLWKPVERLVKYMDKVCSGSMIQKASVVNVFSTFFLLSFIKLLSVTFTLLAPTTLYDVHGNKTRIVLYYDPSIEYFGEKHLPYAVIAITVLLLFVICPFLFLTLYPFKWFQRCLNICRVRNQAIHIFADSYLGWFKNGTEEGERDCRFVVSVYLGLRIGLLIVYMFSLTVYTYAVAAGALIVFSIVLLIARPYKDHWDTYNRVDPCAMLLTALWCVAVLGVNIATEKALELVYFTAVIIFIVSALPLVCMISVLLFRLLKQSGTFVRGVSWLKQKSTRRTDYESLNGSDDVDIPQI